MLAHQRKSVGVNVQGKKTFIHEKNKAVYSINTGANVTLFICQRYSVTEVFTALARVRLLMSR